MKMLTVNKCCCCFDLKYGFLAWATISLVLRLTTIIMVFYSDYLPIQQPEAQASIRSMLPLMGYCIASAIGLLIAVKGIVQGKSMLIYPYIVILVLDVVVGVTSYIILGITVSWIYLVLSPAVAALGIYIFVCLISLYKEIKRSEENNQQSKNKSVNLV